MTTDSSASPAPIPSTGAPPTEARPFGLAAIAAHPLATAAVALTVALPALYFVLRTAWFGAHEPFGRDQGIFQYVAFALSRGQRDYVDLHEINGPLTHAIHVVLYAVAGDDEYAIRIIDTIVSGVVFFGAGMAVPGVGWRPGDAPARARWVTRLSWGLAAFVAFFAHYFLYKWWDRTQRESFYNLFFLVSLSLQLLAQIPNALSERRRMWLVVAAGAFSVIPSFGKPTCVLLTAAQLGGLLLDDEMPMRRGRRAFAFVGGTLLGCVPMVGWILAYADARALLEGLLLDAARVYRHIWHKSLPDAYVAWNSAPLLNYGVVTAALSVPLLAFKVVPRRVLTAILFLYAGLVTWVVQGKGFPYHVQPITCAAHLIWLLALAVVAERASQRAHRGVYAFAIAAAAFLSWHFTQDVTLSQTMHDRDQWYADSVTAEGRRERLPRHFNYGDFFAWDLRRAGWFIKSVSDPSERVQVYGMDPYVLFFAQRLSATPFLYSFELNVDAALAGGSGGAPTESEKAWIRARAAGNVAKLTEAVRAHPPAAFVMLDNQPFSYPQDADADFQAHCPEAYGWMQEHYVRVRRFGAVRVWLRNDLVERANRVPPGPG